MTAEIILKHIPSKYSNLQIEASLILAFLRQKQLDGINHAILESPQFDLEILQKILNSVVMDYYVSKTSYAIEGNYKCYQKKYIQRFSIPQFTDDELTYLKNEPDMSSINQFLIEKYGLSDFRI